MTEYSELEERIEYLSTQVDWLIELQEPYPSPLTPFRKEAMLLALTFTQEMLALKIFGSVSKFRKTGELDIYNGLLPFPTDTVQLFETYSEEGEITDEKIRRLLTTVIPYEDHSAQRLIMAWEASQAQFNRNDSDS